MSKNTKQLLRNRDDRFDRARALAWDKRQDRKKDHEAGKASQFLGPKAYRYRDRLNKLADKIN